MENVLGISGDADVVLENKNKFGFWYPNFYEFLINSKRAKLLFEEPAFGNGISPYVLWACLNQQFANAELKNIKFYEAQVYICELTTENCEEQFSEIIQLVNTSLSKQKFRDIMDDVQRYFKYYINDVGEKVEIKFKIKGKEDAFSISTFLSRYKDYAKEFISSLISYYSEAPIGIDRSFYINKCITEGDIKGDELKKIYAELGKVKMDFFKEIQSASIGKSRQAYLDSGFEISSELKKRGESVLSLLKKKDQIFLKGIFSLEGKSTFNHLSGLFLKMEKKSASRKMFDKKTYYPFSVNESPKSFHTELL